MGYELCDKEVTWPRVRVDVRPRYAQRQPQPHLQNPSKALGDLQSGGGGLFLFFFFLFFFFLRDQQHEPSGYC